MVGGELVKMDNPSFPENSCPTNMVNQEAEEVVGEEVRLRVEAGDRKFASNRWPQEETSALLKIRSEMDDAFRNSGHRALLWEEVSRKLSEHGFIRSSKKCKEKFENIYKYHRRTKDCRSARPNSKNYRFFEQLEALDSPLPLSSLRPNLEGVVCTNTATPLNVKKPNSNVAHDDIMVTTTQTPGAYYVDTSTPTSSSSKECDKKVKKRKLPEFFQRLMKEVIEKQESLHMKFISAMDKFEKDRIARDEAWKMKEMERIKRERELLVQERSIAAAKDAAVLAFLQKFSEQTNSGEGIQVPVSAEKEMEKQDNSSPGGDSYLQLSSSRWPKEEVDALIRLRTNLDSHYDDNGPKGPLWEEVSAAMKKLGYDRNAKRCKEKWENMNKYYKKVKEGNKRRPEDAKTCPYYNQLDALYKQKSRKIDSLINSGYDLKPEELLMHMMGAQEEQKQLQPAGGSQTEDGESENADQSQDDFENSMDDDGHDYHQVLADHTPSSMGIMG